MSTCVGNGPQSVPVHNVKLLQDDKRRGDRNQHGENHYKSGYKYWSALYPGEWSCVSHWLPEWVVVCTVFYHSSCEEKAMLILHLVVIIKLIHENERFHGLACLCLCVRGLIQVSHIGVTFKPTMEDYCSVYMQSKPDLLCMNDLFNWKSLDSGVPVVQDKQAGSRWPWALLCNCSELTHMAYLGFLGLQET